VQGAPNLAGDARQPQLAAVELNTGQRKVGVVRGAARKQDHASLVIVAQFQVDARGDRGDVSAGLHAAALQQHQVIGQPRHLAHRVAHIDHRD
jgi:hypothetical protein